MLGFSAMGIRFVALLNIYQAQGTAQSFVAQLPVGNLALYYYAIEQSFQITFIRGQNVGQDPENPGTFSVLCPGGYFPVS